ncbi:hypothetical protein C4D60_Mb07t10290 [Musa balbisiana]|uniref:Uncharacterized protein n=1 Tax=Musa balbisiana TaxID=52838 RepID=A0A4S8JEW0_MUSBA|nr:hypothetical protein C4D60_Mb07t10290 [Musa balbisiana]
MTGAVPPPASLRGSAAGRSLGEGEGGQAPSSLEVIHIASNLEEGTPIEFQGGRSPKEINPKLRICKGSNTWYQSNSSVLGISLPFHSYPSSLHNCPKQFPQLLKRSSPNSTVISTTTDHSLISPGTTAINGRYYRLTELGDRARAVPPPVRGGATAQSHSETEPRRCHRLTGAAVPSPDRGSATAQPHSEARQLGSAIADPGGASAAQGIWLRQGPNCPKINTAINGRYYRLTELGDRARAVPPPVRGGATAQSHSETEPRQCHRLTGAVLPPTQSHSEIEPRRCHRLTGAVLPPSLTPRLSLGGATA